MQIANEFHFYLVKQSKAFEAIPKNTKYNSDFSSTVYKWYYIYDI